MRRIQSVCSTHHLHRFTAVLCLMQTPVSAQIQSPYKSVQAPTICDTVAALASDLTGDEFGSAMASGDFNGDGHVDVVVGAPSANVPYTRAGRVDVFLGGNPLSEPDMALFPDYPTRRFGLDVAMADLNGDQYDDVIVGGTAFVYVFLGGSTPDTVPDLAIAATIDPEVLDGFGSRVSGIGDFNADSYQDFIIAAPDYTGSSPGKAYVFFGGASLDAVPDLVFIGAEAHDQFGHAVEGIGDTNGDGISDLLIGAREANSGYGAAYLYLGSASPDSTADLTLTPIPPYSSGDFGTSASSAGDMNADGFGDFVVGGGGWAYVYLGAYYPNPIPFTKIHRVGPGATTIFDIAGGEDINSDGFSDLVIGVSSLYQVYGYFGSPAPDSTADWQLGGEPGFGRRVEVPGDIDGDGLSDVVVGGQVSGDSVGEVFVFSCPDCLNGQEFVACRSSGAAELLFSARHSQDASSLGPPGAPVYFDSTLVEITKQPGDRLVLSGSASGAGPLVCDDEIYIAIDDTIAGVSLGPYTILDPTFPICKPVDSILQPLPAIDVSRLLPNGTYCIEFKLGDTQREVYGNTPIFLVNTTQLGIDEQNLRTMQAARVSVFPNPTSRAATILVESEVSDFMKITILDLRGRVVRDLGSANRPTGNFSLLWDGIDDRGRPVPSGIYLSVVQGSRTVATGKLVIIR